MVDFFGSSPQAINVANISNELTLFS